MRKLSIRPTTTILGTRKNSSSMSHVRTGHTGKNAKYNILLDLFGGIETRLEADESLTGVEEDISEADLETAANQYDRPAIPDALPERTEHKTSRWHILQIDFIAEYPNGSLEETTYMKCFHLLQEYFEAYPDEREQFDFSPDKTIQSISPKRRATWYLKQYVCLEFFTRTEA
ncbi:hypothetical protein DL768_009641 [Monosporascus sp. mg162]|nr:hypothetical protein DL768_009641 [Monosporascus sp. mg162]